MPSSLSSQACSKTSLAIADDMVGIEERPFAGTSSSSFCERLPCARQRHACAGPRRRDRAGRRGSRRCPPPAFRDARSAARRNRCGLPRRRPRSRRRAAPICSGKFDSGGTSDLKLVGPVEALAGADHDACRRPMRGDRAVAVELDLVQPVVAVRRSHRRASRAAGYEAGSLRARAFFFDSCGARLPGPAFLRLRSGFAGSRRFAPVRVPLRLARGDLLHGAAAAHAGHVASRSAACLSVRRTRPLLDQQPVLVLVRLRCRGLAHADQRPAALAAARRAAANLSLPLRSPSSGSPSGSQVPAIPQHHRAAAIFALRGSCPRNRRSRAGDPRRARRAACRPGSRLGPRVTAQLSSDAVKLQAEVVVQPASRRASG